MFREEAAILLDGSTRPTLLSIIIVEYVRSARSTRDDDDEKVETVR